MPHFVSTPDESTLVAWTADVMAAVSRKDLRPFAGLSRMRGIRWLANGRMDRHLAGSRLSTARLHPTHTH